MDSFINLVSSNKRLFWLVVIASVLFVAATVSKLFLPANSPSFSSSEPSNYYKNYPFDRAMGLKHQSTTPQTDTVSVASSVTTLDGIKLKAIYAQEGGGGFVVVEDAKNSIFVDLNGELKGYKLVAIEPKKAIFTKGGVTYELTLIDNTPTIKAPQPALQVKPRGTPQMLSKISRQELNRYKNDPRMVWDNIGINPITENGRFKEFRVTFVAKGSVFEQLGIQPGDVLKRANGVELDGYAAALKLYSEVDKIETLRLEIIRNNQIRELTYEIN